MAKARRVSSLTVEELENIIETAVEKKLKNILRDPDYGLPLTEETEILLRDSLASPKRIPLKDVKKRSGLV